MAMRIGRSTASTSYSIAARLRRENDTSRLVVSFTSWPEAARQWSSALEQPAAEVEPALVVEHLAAVHVERLVLHLEPDDLAVGHVHHRLAVLGEAVPALAVLEREGLVEAVQVGAAQPGGLALVEVAAQPDVAVRQREQRLGLGEPVDVHALLDQGPGLDGVPRRRRSSTSSARSLTTMSAPCSSSACGSPWRSTPTTRPNPPARPAPTPASASSNTAPASGVHAEQLGAAQERVGGGLALEVLARDHHAVHARVEEIADARRPRVSARCWRSRTPPRS